MILDKVSSIWLNLEDNYTTMGLNSRRAYLEKVCGYSEGKSQLTVLRTRMASESKTYNSEQLDTYSKILIMFDNTEAFLGNTSMGELSSFSFLTRESEDIVKDIPEDLISKLYKERSDDFYSPQFVDLSTALSVYNTFLNKVFIKDNEVINVTIRDNDYFCASDKHSFVDFVNTCSDKEFLKKVMHITQVLMKENKFLVPSVFISSKYFSKNEATEKYTFNCGGKSSTVTPNFLGEGFACKNMVQSRKYTLVMVE